MAVSFAQHIAYLGVVSAETAPLLAPRGRARRARRRRRPQGRAQLFRVGGRVGLGGGGVLVPAAGRPRYGAQVARHGQRVTGGAVPGRGIDAYK